MIDRKLIDLLYDKKFDEAREMIKASDDKEALISGRDGHGYNAIDLAILKKVPDDLILEMIESGGAAVFATTRYGDTPLHWAVNWGVSYEVLKVLIAKNPEALDQKDNGGNTPRDYLECNSLDERSKQLMKKSTQEILNLLASEDDKKKTLKQETIPFDVKMIQKQIADLKNEVTTLRQSNDKFEMKLKKQAQELATLRVSLETEKNDTADKLMEMEEQLKDQRNKILLMEKTEETRQQEISSLKAELTALHESLEKRELVEKQENVLSNVNMIKKQMEDLKNELSTLRESNKNSEMTRKKQEHDLVRSDVMMMQKRMEGLKHELATLRKTNESEMTRKLQEHELVHSDVEMIQKQMQSLKHELATLCQSHDIFSQRYESSLKNELADLQHSHEEEICQLKQQMEKLTDENDEISQMKTEISDLKQQLEHNETCQTPLSKIKEKVLVSQLLRQEQRTAERNQVCDVQTFIGTDMNSMKQMLQEEVASLKQDIGEIRSGVFNFVQKQLVEKKSIAIAEKHFQRPAAPERNLRDNMEKNSGRRAKRAKYGRGWEAKN